MKKIYFLLCNFILQKFKPKTKIMYNFTDKQIKEFINHVALILIKVNGSTTTLEVKNSLHDLLPGIELTQSKVSFLMDGLYHESSEFSRENQSTGGNYYKYSLVEINEPVVNNTPSPIPDTVAVSSDTTNVNIFATAKTGSNSAVVGQLINYPNDFLKRLDGKLMIGFKKGDSNFFLTNTTDRYEARDLFKKNVPTAKHNDVRTISINTYLKRNHLV